MLIIDERSRIILFGDTEDIEATFIIFVDGNIVLINKTRYLNIKS